MDLLAVSVGNTRTRFGLFRGRELDHASVALNADPEGLSAAILGAPRPRADTPIIVASVNEPVAGPLCDRLRVRGPVYRFGTDLEVPVRQTLRDASGVGQDRLLNAIGAFSRAEQACIVIDAGTAITVDFVDGQGVFHGGAIAPGVNMMLRALHEHTAALPEVAFEPGAPAHGQDEVFGRDTRSAMLLGATSAARGLVRLLTERYAEFYGGYPQIIATGGDARALFEGDEVVEHIVPDLTLFGIQSACATLLGDGDESPAP